MFSDSPEEKIRQLEVLTMDLIEESCLASCRNDGRLALDKAKEASTKERTLIRQRDQAGLSDQHNMELTFVVSRQGLVGVTCVYCTSVDDTTS